MKSHNRRVAYIVFTVSTSITITTIIVLYLWYYNNNNYILNPYCINNLIHSIITLSKNRSIETTTETNHYSTATTTATITNSTTTAQEDHQQSQSQEQQQKQQQQHKWNWDPSSVHKCNIKRYTENEWSYTRLQSHYHHQQQQQQQQQHNTLFSLLMNQKNQNKQQQHQYQEVSYGIVPSFYHIPIIIQRNPKINTKIQYKTQRNQIVHEFQNYIHNNTTNTTIFNVTLSSSNAYSEHRKTISLEEYMNNSYNQIETLPNQFANETWYLFGETYNTIWYNTILQYYILPPCSTCNNHNHKNKNHNNNIALSFGIGNIGSGVQWHTHGPGFSETLHGKKHWILYPPTPNDNDNNSSNMNTTKTRLLNTIIQEFHKDYSSRYWMEYIYPNITIQPYECTIEPNEIIYFPNHWWHATINLNRYTAFISTFVNDNDIDIDDTATTSSNNNNIDNGNKRNNIKFSDNDIVEKSDTSSSYTVDPLSIHMDEL